MSNNGNYVTIEPEFISVTVQIVALFGYYDTDHAGTMNYDQLIMNVLERSKGPPAPVLHPIPASPLATMHFIESKRAPMEVTHS